MLLPVRMKLGSRYGSGAGGTRTLRWDMLHEVMASNAGSEESNSGCSYSSSSGYYCMASLSIIPTQLMMIAVVSPKSCQFSYEPHRPVAHIMQCPTLPPIIRKAEVFY